VARRATEEAYRSEHGRQQQQQQQQGSEDPSEATLAAMLQQQAEGQPESAAALAALLQQVERQDEGMQWAVQMMAQQERQRQQLAALAAVAARPQEHYIRIAQNGEFFCLSFGLVMHFNVSHSLSVFAFRHHSRGNRDSDWYPSRGIINDICL
jgi:hypothetical protein